MGLNLRSAVTLLKAVIFYFSILSLSAFASQQKKQISFTKIDESKLPIIDGNLDDSIWQNLPIVSDLHQSTPVAYATPSEKTEIQLARSNTHIYVAFKVFDSDADGLLAKELIQGRAINSDDRVGVYLGSFGDARNAYYFQVNANGVRRDALAGNDYFIDEWQTVWHAATQQYEWGWSAEMAIPLKSISFNPNAEHWDINFDRNNPRLGEEIAWSSQQEKIFPGIFGKIDNVKGFNQGKGIELAPAISIGAKKPRNQSTDTFVEPSLTSFYNLTPFLTAGVTFNTDFSATEVDDRQVNLDRFSLFFPEKRDFFLRDAGIFEFGAIQRNGKPFFSRRLGLSRSGKPLDIDAGFRLSGRAGDWNLGALAIRQESDFNDGSDNLLVARATRNLFEESAVGLIATSGNPSSELSNNLFGIDYKYANSQFLGDQKMRANVWYQQSDTEGVASDQSAYGARIEFPNYKYSGHLDLRRVNQNFNPGLGFVSRAGVDQIASGFAYKHRLDNRFQWYRSKLSLFRTDRLDGGLQTQNLFFSPVELLTKENDFFAFIVGEKREGLIKPFEIREGIVIPEGQYASKRYGVVLESGIQRALSAKLEVFDGGFYNGDRFNVEAQIDWRPNKHIYASIAGEVNDISMPEGNFISRLYSARLNVAFDHRWAWLNVIQADNFSNTVSINSRLRFQSRPDREYFLVFDQTRDRISDEVTNSGILFKASFNFRY